MAFSVREYLYWTFVPDPRKYSRLIDEDTQLTSMSYMTLNTAQWGVRAYLSGGNVTEFKAIGHVLTSPHLPVYGIGSSVVASVAAEAFVFTSVIPQIQEFESVPWWQKFLWVSGQ